MNIISTKSTLEYPEYLQLRLLLRLLRLLLLELTLRLLGNQFNFSRLDWVAIGFVEDLLHADLL